MTVPRLSLVDQSIEKLRAEGVTNLGVIQGNHWDTNAAALVQLCSIQTLMRRLIPNAREILIDEAHIWFRYYPKILEAPAFTDVPIIGFTATPWTKGLGKHFDHLLIGTTTDELIQTGYLSKFRVYAPASPDLRGVSIDYKTNDYKIGELANAMGKVELVANVIDTWLEKAEGRPTILFGVDRAHAKQLQQQFIVKGVAAEYIDCFTKAPERKAIASRFHTGEVKVVCSVGTLTIGVDWDVRCIILARPTKSEMLFVQMVGRGLRTADGKADCLILDHSDNHTRLGFVTDIHHEHLDRGDKELRDSVPRQKLPKPCPECGYLKPPKVLECPSCGHVPVPQPGAIHREGALIELRSRSEAQPATTTERIDFYRQLRHVQLEREYKSGWAAHQYKTRHGSFPPWAWNDFPPKAPTTSTLAWIKSRLIAYAKARSAA